MVTTRIRFGRTLGHVPKDLALAPEERAASLDRSRRCCCEVSNQEDESRTAGDIRRGGMEGTERLFVVALLYMVAAAVAAGATRLSLPRDNRENKKCRPRPAGPFWKAIEHRVDAAEIAAHAALGGAMTETTKAMGALYLSLACCRSGSARVVPFVASPAVGFSLRTSSKPKKSRICERILVHIQAVEWVESVVFYVAR
jgi:hypothetical protein